jgi:hypothetical protein
MIGVQQCSVRRAADSRDDVVATASDPGFVPDLVSEASLTRSQRDRVDLRRSEDLAGYVVQRVARHPVGLVVHHVEVDGGAGWQVAAGHVQVDSTRCVGGVQQQSVGIGRIQVGKDVRHHFQPALAKDVPLSVPNQQIQRAPLEVALSLLERTKSTPPRGHRGTTDSTVIPDHRGLDRAAHVRKQARPRPLPFALGKRDVDPLTRRQATEAERERVTNLQFLQRLRNRPRSIEKIDPDLALRLTPTPVTTGAQKRQRQKQQHHSSEWMHEILPFSGALRHQPRRTAFTPCARDARNAATLPLLSARSAPGGV